MHMQARGMFDDSSYLQRFKWFVAQVGHCQSAGPRLLPDPVLGNESDSGNGTRATDHLHLCK